MEPLECSSAEDPESPVLAHKRAWARSLARYEREYPGTPARYDGMGDVGPRKSAATDPSRHEMSKAEFVAGAMASAVCGPEGKSARC